MAKEQIKSTLLTEDILESLESHEPIKDDETYEDYLDSFNDQDPF